MGSTDFALGAPKTQALAVTDSATKFSLRDAERKGAGLLSLVAKEHGVGLFEVVFLGQGVEGIEPGTKLIIEKEAKGAK